MSKSRRLCIEEILKDLQNLFDQKEDKQVQDMIDKNHTEAFRQMCYYQSYLDKKENTNMMKSEYLKFKGIYLCYKDPKIALLALQKEILNKSSGGILKKELSIIFCITIQLLFSDKRGILKRNQSE